MTSSQRSPSRSPRRRIETPSWAYGNSGTRFKVFAQPGVPRTAEEKIADAADVHRFTGVAPTVALHIPWDKVDDYAAPGAVRRGAGRRARRDQHQRLPGRRLQARQRHQPRPGGAAQGDRPPARVRRHHGRDRLARPEAVVLRRHQLPGPGRHAGPAGPARRRRCAEIYDRLGDDQRMLLEYKLFEPAFYTTDVPDWGTSYAHCLDARRAGDGRASTPGTTRRARTSSSSWRSCCGREARRVRLQLPVLRRRRPDGRRGGPVPAVPDHVRDRPRRRARTRSRGIAFMLDQCHNIEPKIPAIIRSVMNVQEATAKALLRRPRRAGGRAATRATCSAANAVLMDAYNTDVRPLLAGWREERGPDPDPIAGLPAPAATTSRSRRTAPAAPQAGWGADERHDATRRPSWSRGSNRSVPTRATPTTPAATPRPRARRPTR